MELPLGVEVRGRPQWLVHRGGPSGDSRCVPARTHPKESTRWPRVRIPHTSAAKLSPIRRALANSLGCEHRRVTVRLPRGTLGHGELSPSMRLTCLTTATHGQAEVPFADRQQSRARPLDATVRHGAECRAEGLQVAPSMRCWRRPIRRAVLMFWGSRTVIHPVATGVRL